MSYFTKIRFNDLIRLSFLICFSVLPMIICAQCNDEKNDSIKYTLNIDLVCNDSDKSHNVFTLYFPCKDSLLSYRSDTNGHCLVPRLGFYHIDYFSEKGAIFDLIEVKYNSQIDTLIIPPIYEAFELDKLDKRNQYFSHCGSICNGKYKIYRDNGLLWQKGRFRNAN